MIGNSIQLTDSLENIYSQVRERDCRANAIPQGNQNEICYLTKSLISGKFQL